MLISIPTNDPSWQRLPDDVRREALAWCSLLNTIHASKNRQRSMRAGIGTIGRKSTRKCIENRYYAAKRNGWRSCVNWSKVPGRQGLPALFIEFWIGLNEKRQRDLSGKRAHSALREQYRCWLAGDHAATIPGYDRCPRPRGSTGLPNGWDYTNLMRLLKAYWSDAERKLARQGIAAARAHLPNVPQDISDVRPLEYVVFDDVEVDFLISVSGSLTPVKLRLLVAMDLCSRVILGFGVRPAVTRPDGVEDSLKLRDMKCIVARVLSKWGFPLDYPMTLIVERATATLKPGDIAALNEISEGQIRVSLTSMITGSVFEFTDRATGNSWGKAWLESFFNWLHNELGDRTGQKGRRYDLAPAELHGRTKELALLMRAGQRMPLALRQQLQVPFMDGEQALQEISIAFAKANARTDHALQGFDRIQIWRSEPDGKFKSLAELPQFAERLGMEISALAPRLDWDDRMESPNERFQSRIMEVRRQELSAAALHRLMDEHRRVKFSDFQFSFDYQSKEYIYLPNDSLIVQLKHDEHYLAWFDPADLSVIYLTRDFPHRGWLGEVKLFRRTRRGEIEEKKDRLRQVKHTLNQAAGLVASRHPEKFDTAIARAENNVELIRNVSALEIEAEVVAPLAPQASHTDSAAVQEMTKRIVGRAHEKQREQTSEKRLHEIQRGLSDAKRRAMLTPDEFEPKPEGEDED
ncbi:MAG: hypothetical protein ACJ74Y_10740 [Bryobacteraceae bacterium]